MTKNWWSHQAKIICFDDDDFYYFITKKLKKRRYARNVRLNVEFLIKTWFLRFNNSHTISSSKIKINLGLVVTTDAEHHTDRTRRILNLGKRRQNDCRWPTANIDKRKWTAVELLYSNCDPSLQKTENGNSGSLIRHSRVTLLHVIISNVSGSSTNDY